jgi:hypothetical protein
MRVKSIVLAVLLLPIACSGSAAERVDVCDILANPVKYDHHRVTFDAAMHADIETVSANGFDCFTKSIGIQKDYKGEWPYFELLHEAQQRAPNGVGYWPVATMTGTIRVYDSPARATRPRLRTVILENAEITNPRLEQVSQ